MKKVINLILILLLICICSVGFIFFNSSESSKESNLRSYKITERVMEFSEHNEFVNKQVNRITTKIAEIEHLDNSNIKQNKEILNTFIRKCAHAFEFCFLSIALCITFNALKIVVRDVVIYSLFLVLVGAVIDEVYQLFVTGRNSSVVDVIIDFIGGMVACIIFVIIRFTYNVIRHQLRHIAKRTSIKH